MHPKSTPKCFTAVLHNVLVIVLPVPPQKDKACLSREPGLVTKNEGEGGGRSRKLQPLFFTSCYSPYIPVAQAVKRLPTMRETWVLSLGREFPIPWRRKWQPTPVCLLGKSHGRRSLVGYSPWGRKDSDTTEQLHFTFTHPTVLGSREARLQRDELRGLGNLECSPPSHTLTPPRFRGPAPPLTGDEVGVVERCGWRAGEPSRLPEKQPGHCPDGHRWGSQDAGERAPQKSTRG